MAYAALVSLAQTIEKILIHDQHFNFLNHKQQILSLNNSVISLQSSIEDLPEKASSLAGRIRDIANEAEDIIDYFMLEQIRPQFERNLGSSRPKFDHQLKQVTEKIDLITGEVMNIKNLSFKNNVKDEQISDFSAASSSSNLAPTHKDVVIGFDDDLMEMKDRLCGESSKLEVLPIYGMGGIVKTTLARNAYDDPLITKRFEIRSWVTVSQDYRADRILSDLLGFIKVVDAKAKSNEERVHKSLKGRRYLIVIDDLWSTEAWDDVRKIFPDDGNGSRIMLTTRLAHVATYAYPGGPPYEMHLMNADQSWNMLREKVFAHQNCPPKLEEIGKKIARSCRGLPLAIVVIAGLLSTVGSSLASWEEIAENVNSVVVTKDAHFEKILALRDTHLPHHLKSCFLHMGGFPEVHEIRVSKLMKLWVAEGFLKHPNGAKSLEEEAEECLEDLVKRSLVLVTKRKSNGKIKSCSLHDVMQDLSIRKAHEDRFLLNMIGRFVEKEHSIKSIKNHHHLSIDSSALTYLSSICGSTIHTIMCIDNNISVVLDFLESFRLLRVLDVEHAYVGSAQLFELFHLRYLAFKFPIRIPADISKLQNLQTLIINNERALGVLMEALPREIWRMPQLRHLHFCGRLPDPDTTSSALENLQTLSKLSLFVY